MQGEDDKCSGSATATPFKFPETCKRAFGGDVLGEKPASFAALETLPVVQNKVIETADIEKAVKELFGK